MSPKAFIFDFDGVVADSLAAHLRAWESAHQALFGTPLQDAQKLVGLSTEEIASILANEAGMPETRKALILKKIASLKVRSRQVALYPQVAEIFAELLRRDRPFGICSNASSDYIREVLSQNNVTCRFITGLYEAGRPKPAPDGYLKAAAQLGFSNSNTASIAAFEDSLHGLAAIIAAGMYPVGIATQHSPDLLRQHGATTVFANLSEAKSAGFFN